MSDNEGDTTPKADGGPEFLRASTLIDQVHSRSNAHRLLYAYSAHCLDLDEDDAQSPVPRAHYITHYQLQLPKSTACVAALTKGTGRRRQ